MCNGKYMLDFLNMIGVYELNVYWFMNLNKYQYNFMLSYYF